MIEIKNLCKTFPTKDGTFTALNNINLNVNDGEIFGIIGLSGAGKSTLVRCINYLEKPDSGEVLIDGVDLGKLRKKQLLKTRQNIGMIFQGFNLLSQRTVLGNICYPLEVAGIKKKDALKRAYELLELVGMSDKAKSYPSQLSGGQKQRVAIARALATQTKYLLCDEATSALDPDTTRSILDLMVKINKELGVTIIVITHEMEIIDSICENVAVMDKGEIKEIGTVSSVFTNPESDIAKKLILPNIKISEKVTGKNKIRIVFNGESSDKPVLANLILEVQEHINVLHAETNDVDGKAYGQMILQLPESERSIDRIKTYLKENNISYSEI